MDREQAKSMREAFNAFCDGKRVETMYSGIWIEQETPTFNPEYQWRVKPQPKYRPWTFEEVPIGNVVRTLSGNIVCMIERKSTVATGSESVYVEGRWITLGHLFLDYVFLDGTPCGVEIKE